MVCWLTRVVQPSSFDGRRDLAANGHRRRNESESSEVFFATVVKDTWWPIHNIHHYPCEMYPRVDTHFTRANPFV